MDHVVLDRLNEHVEDGDEFALSMFGFRTHLSTQGVLLQLKKRVMQPGSPADARRCLLNLDLKKAFDNVAHAVVLESRTQLGVGNRAYLCVQNFLTDRKCRIKVGEHETDILELGSAAMEAALGQLLFAFSVNLYKQLLNEDSKANGNNLLCSPLTIAATLGMTLAGARNDTAKQIRDLFVTGVRFDPIRVLLTE
nr:uncharacterized protein LOC129384920 [Dermacentor andersoni]